jgi:hypothetical protein
VSRRRSRASDPCPCCPLGMSPAAVRTPMSAPCFEGKPSRPARPTRSQFKAGEHPRACRRSSISLSSPFQVTHDQVAHASLVLTP